MQSSNTLGQAATALRRYDRPTLACGPRTRPRRHAVLSVPLVKRTGRFEDGLGEIVFVAALQHTCL